MLVTRGLGRGNSQGLVNTFGLGINQVTTGGSSLKKKKKKNKIIQQESYPEKVFQRQEYTETAAEVVFRHRREAIIAAEISAKNKTKQAETVYSDDIDPSIEVVSASPEIKNISAIAIDSARERLQLTDEEAALLMLMLAIE